jgi:glycosyltransferase involved in cell wall biosynthesis
MKIALIHDSLNVLGGAEMLALGFAKALKELDHIVHLYTLEKTDWERVHRIFGYSSDVVDKEFVLLPGRTFPTIYGGLANWFWRDVAGIYAIRQHHYDLTIITKQIMLPVFSDIIYVHFPVLVPGFESYYYPDRYVHNVWLRAYSRPEVAIRSVMLSVFKSMQYKPLILTNSRFSAAVIKRLLGVNAIVLYPPVNVEKYLPLSKNTKRKRIVLTISRIAPEKGLEIIPDVAREVKDVKFVIMGALGSTSYYRSLMSKIKAVGVGDRIKVLPNVSEDLKIELMAKAKIYLHPMRYEHFGIAVVEAMAAGLLPIVHKSGGPWIDIVEGGKYGRGYSRVDELIYHINTAIDSQYEFTARLVTERTRSFSFNAFKTRVNKILEILKL